MACECYIVHYNIMVETRFLSHYTVKEFSHFEVNGIFRYTCPRYLEDFLKINTHTCERNAIEINERENNQCKISSLTHYHVYTKKKSQEQKQISEIYNRNVYIFFHWEDTRNTSHNLSTLSSGTFISFALKNL